VIKKIRISQFMDVYFPGGYKVTIDLSKAIFHDIDPVTRCCKACGMMESDIVAMMDWPKQPTCPGEPLAITVTTSHSEKI